MKQRAHIVSLGGYYFAAKTFFASGEIANGLASDVRVRARKCTHSVQLYVHEVTIFVIIVSVHRKIFVLDLQISCFFLVFYFRQTHTYTRTQTNSLSPSAALRHLVAVVCIVYL